MSDVPPALSGSMLGLHSTGHARPVAEPLDGADTEVIAMLAYIRKVARVRDDKGASAVEYGLLVAAIAALVVLIVFALGGVVRGVFKDTCDKVKTNATQNGGVSQANTNCTDR